jgi:hypothetical protein
MARDFMKSSAVAANNAIEELQEANLDGSVVAEAPDEGAQGHYGTDHHSGSALSVWRWRAGNGCVCKTEEFDPMVGLGVD